MYLRAIEDNEKSRRGYEEEVRTELARLKTESRGLLAENGELRNELVRAGLRLTEISSV